MAVRRGAEVNDDDDGGGARRASADSSFTVRGMRNGSLVHVTWQDGRLSGDPPTVDLVIVEAELGAVYRADTRLGGARAELHAGLHDQPLTDPDSAYGLIASVIDRVQEVTGDLPPSAARDVPS